MSDPLALMIFWAFSPALLVVVGGTVGGTGAVPHASDENRFSDGAPGAPDEERSSPDASPVEARYRVTPAEAERDELRARLEAAQAAPAATEAPTVLIVEGDRPPPPPTLWQRLRRALRLS